MASQAGNLEIIHSGDSCLNDFRLLFWFSQSQCYIWQGWENTRSKCMCSWEIPSRILSAIKAGLGMFGSSSVIVKLLLDFDSQSSHSVGGWEGGFNVDKRWSSLNTLPATPLSPSHLPVSQPLPCLPAAPLSQLLSGRDLTAETRIQSDLWHDALKHRLLKNRSLEMTPWAWLLENRMSTGITDFPKPVCSPGRIHSQPYPWSLCFSI